MFLSHFFLPHAFAAAACYQVNNKHTPWPPTHRITEQKNKYNMGKVRDGRIFLQISNEKSNDDIENGGK
jgi:hypothetical protein